MKVLKENDFWQTPQYILDAVNKMWPDGWFDPCPVNPDFDGLKIKWPDKCFINPPFSQYKQWAFHGFFCGFEQIWIMDHDHSTKRMQTLFPGAVFCLLYDRVAFIDPKTGKPKNAQPRCQTLIYRGNNPKRFIECFGRLGVILEEATA